MTVKQQLACYNTYNHESLIMLIFLNKAVERASYKQT